MPHTSRLQQISFAFSQAEALRLMALPWLPGMRMVNCMSDQFQMQRTARHRWTRHSSLILQGAIRKDWHPCFAGVRGIFV